MKLSHKTLTLVYDQYEQKQNQQYYIIIDPSTLIKSRPLQHMHHKQQQISSEWCIASQPAGQIASSLTCKLVIGQSLHELVQSATLDERNTCAAYHALLKHYILTNSILLGKSGHRKQEPEACHGTLKGNFKKVPAVTARLFVVVNYYLFRIFNK